jgi:hypothetical protein
MSTSNNTPSRASSYSGAKAAARKSRPNRDAISPRAPARSPTARHCASGANRSLPGCPLGPAPNDAYACTPSRDRQGVPMGLRPTKPPEDAAGRSRRISTLDRVFRGAVLGSHETVTALCEHQIIDPSASRGGAAGIRAPMANPGTACHLTPAESGSCSAPATFRMSAGQGSGHARLPGCARRSSSR